MVLFLIQYVSQTLTAMKILNSFKVCALMITATSLYSCGGGEGNTGNKVTEIDSVRDSTHILHHEHIPDPDEDRRFVADNAVQATFASATDFNWEDFKNGLAAKQEAIGEGFSQEEDKVTTAWQKLNDRISYQTVYHHQDGEVWLQTYYKDHSQKAGNQSNEEGTLLTKAAAENQDLMDLWNNMEAKAANP